jgi:2-dehydro-3-deoxyphosphogalactonate aldolase
MTPYTKFKTAMGQLPLVAILRGLHPLEALAVGQVLVDAGWDLIEVPLNSPQPLQSIATLRQAFPQALVGAGTVLTPEDVRQVHSAGGELIVSPNFNPAVVAEAVRLGMVCLPGVMTASEAFAALAAGASGLKIFPAEMITPQVLKALRAVLPADALVLPVGSISPLNMPAFRDAGANGFGIGSALFKPGMTPAQVAESAAEFKAAWAGTMRA